QPPPRLLQPLQRVILGLFLPLTLALERGKVVRRVRVPNRLRRIHQDLGQLLLLLRTRQLVTPQPRLRPHPEQVTADLEIRLLTVDVNRQPQARLQVLTPAVLVRLETHTGGRNVSPVEPYDGIVLIFHPNASVKPAPAAPRPGRDVENQAAHIAQKLAPYKAEDVVAAIEILINQDARSGKIKTYTVNRQHLVVQAVQEGTDEASLRTERRLVGLFAELQPADKVPVARDHGPQFAVDLELLKVGLGSRAVLVQFLHHLLFARNDAVRHRRYGSNFISLRFERLLFDL